MSSKVSARRMAARAGMARVRGARGAGLALSAWAIPMPFGGTKIIYTLTDDVPVEHPDAKRHMITD